MGLLVFLGADALGEAMETSGLVAAAFQGPALVLLGVVATPLMLAALGRWRGGSGTSVPHLQVATLIALGIGLHNLGEGLAIGASYATGEIALGTFLVIGFLLHNTTEGLGIVTPLADQRPRPGRCSCSAFWRDFRPFSAPGSVASPTRPRGPRCSFRSGSVLSSQSSTSYTGSSAVGQAPVLQPRSIPPGCWWHADHVRYRAHGSGVRDTA